MSSWLVTRMRISRPLPPFGGGRPAEGRIGGGSARSEFGLRRRTKRVLPVALFRVAGAPWPATPLSNSRPQGGRGLAPVSSSPDFLDLFRAAHMRRERLGHGDAAVLVLVILHNGDEGAADGDAGAVEGVDEARA